MASDITIESFQTCTVGEENINYNLYVAINLLKEGTISSVKEALYLLGKSIESLPGMISDCNSTFDQLDALITATKALLSP